MSASFRLIAFGMISICGITLHSGVLSAEDWPQWRGPHRDGISAETGLSAVWPAGGPKLVWKADSLGDGYGAVSVADSMVFLVSNEGLENELVKALDAKTGEELWSTRIGKVGNPNQKPSYPAARSTPTVDGDMVYALGSDGDLVCLKRSSGEEVWRVSLRSEFEGKPGVWAYAESPLVDGDKVIVTPGGEEAGIVAVDKHSGKPIWKAKTIDMGAAGYASVQKANVSGIDQYVSFMGRGLVGVSANDGTLLWSYPGTSGTANMATPTAGGDVFYSGGGRKGGGAVRLVKEGNEFESEELYFSQKLPSSIGGTVKVGDYLYGCGGSTLMCIGFTSGDIQWQERISAPASLIYADGRFYLHAEDGKVMMVSADSKGMKVVGEFDLPDQPEGVGKQWAYPALADGKLYLRQHGTVWCYDVK
ncbi:PQQ-binding-like beta-propeller repeat protein [bacterium]|nr:PQQ-binding-like beta-propeller repeat protein [bacterium]